MAYTQKNSINEIIKSLRQNLSDPYFHYFYPESRLKIVPENLWDDALENVKKIVRMPWGAPFMTEDVVRAANWADEIITDKIFEFIPLWSESREGYIPHVEENTKESVFLMTVGACKAFKKKAVIICPGGGYEMISADNEGAAIAERMAKQGYYPFVLNYRVNPNLYPEPQTDLALAIQYVRANAERYNIDPQQVLVMGFSAGGHLCASEALYHEEIRQKLMEELKTDHSVLADRYAGISVRPDQICLGYSVISFQSERHDGSFYALTGGNKTLEDKLSLELHIDSKFPKTFLWACEDDMLVPVSNTKRMADALDKCGILHKLSIYPSGGHGCGLAVGTSAEKWLQEMLEFMDQDTVL